VIETVSILGGHGRSGLAEPVKRIDLRMGDVVSIVGPTGSGKTTLINDLELFADGNTPTGRRVLINNVRPPDEYRSNPACNPIALITQHTTFLSDLCVEDFLATHAQIRSAGERGVTELIAETLQFANQLTGEPIRPGIRMTELSGGQTRAMLIADATVICNTPIVLLDEVENAGIHRSKALELLRQHRKIFIFVTHDPSIVLLSNYRLIMAEGGVQRLITTSAQERALSLQVTRMDDTLSHLRNRIRLGHELSAQDMSYEMGGLV
jgi:ABC-type lipoprotein export system ATPase subunit